MYFSTLLSQMISYQECMRVVSQVFEVFSSKVNYLIGKHILNFD